MSRTHPRAALRVARRFLTATAIAAVIGIAVTVPVSAHGELFIQLGAERAAPGGAVEVRGDLGVGSTVEIVLISKADGTRRSIATVTDFEEGHFQQYVTIPPDVAEGDYVVEAGTDTVAVRAPLTVAGNAAVEGGERPDQDEPLIVPLSSGGAGYVFATPAGGAPVGVTGSAVREAWPLPPIGIALLAAIGGCSSRRAPPGRPSQKTGSCKATLTTCGADVGRFGETPPGTTAAGGGSVLRRLPTRIAVLAAIGALVVGVTATPTALASGANQTYLIVYHARAVPSDAAGRISAAGGTLVASYGAIGVAIARSSSDTFKASVKSDGRVAAAAATAKTAVQLNDDQANDDSSATVNAPATDTDSLSGLQWDMRQIHTPEAHAITGGSSDVIVGDIDTGIDFTHPDLAPNVDVANSVNCLSGAPVQGLAAQDDNGHGTHTAGTIAAASNGIGIVGVAPNVRIAGIKAGNAAGFFFPEAVVCAFMWAGSHHLDVTNNSYFADPWLFNCKNDPEQRAIFAAEQRAIKYAQSQGVVVVAAEGNQADDLAHPTQDETSPDDTTPVVRDITNACAVVPVEVPGVVGVTADGNRQIKSFYSSYGMGTVQVIAPGGDSILQLTAAAPNGRVLSTWPASLLTVTCAPARRVVDASGATYCYQQGTSMASPHVAGVAALIASQHPTWSSGAISARITSTADPMACPDTAQYAFFPAVDGGAPQVCTGGTGYNSFNGHGQVNALSAVQ